MNGSGGLVLAAAGAVLLLIGLFDIFVTVFNYDGFTFLAERLHRLVWRILRVTSRLLPVRTQAAYLSLGSAAMLPLTLLWWLALETTAFALMYLPGIVSGGFAVTHGAGGAQGAFYLSGGDLTSLTFGDVVASVPVYRALVDAETAIGLATFTLGLTYVIAAFDAVGALNALHGRVRRQAVAPHRPETILQRHFRDGRADQLSNLLQSLVEDLATYDDALRRYPVVFYFHSRRSERSIPRVFAALGELIELLRWGLPASHEATEDPSLLALVDQYDITTRRLLRSFVGPTALPPASPLARDDFLAAAGSASSDEAAFIALRSTASRAAGVAEDAPAAGYSQYVEWLPFHRRTDIVLERLRTALCYDREAVE